MKITLEESNILELEALIVESYNGAMYLLGIDTDRLRKRKQELLTEFHKAVELYNTLPNRLYICIRNNKNGGYCNQIIHMSTHSSEVYKKMILSEKDRQTQMKECLDFKPTCGVGAACNGADYAFIKNNQYFCSAVNKLDIGKIMQRESNGNISEFRYFESRNKYVADDKDKTLYHLRFSDAFIKEMNVLILQNQ